MWEWKRKRRDPGRSHAPCRLLHEFMCVWQTVSVCVRTWCATGTKTEQRLVQQTSASEREREEESGWRETGRTLILLKGWTQASTQISQITAGQSIESSSISSALFDIILQEEARKSRWKTPGLSKMRSLLWKVFTSSKFGLQNEKWECLTVCNWGIKTLNSKE